MNHRGRKNDERTCERAAVYERHCFDFRPLRFMFLIFR